jgi:hypothetical protein
MTPHYSERVKRFARMVEKTLFHAFPYIVEARDRKGLPYPRPSEIHLNTRPQIEDGVEVQYCAVQDEASGCTVFYRDWRCVYIYTKPNEAFWQAFYSGTLPPSGSASAYLVFEAERAEGARSSSGG